MKTFKARFNEYEVMETVSGLYLTTTLPTDHTEWSDSYWEDFLLSNVAEAYEDLPAEDIMALIHETTSVFMGMIKEKKMTEPEYQLPEVYEIVFGEKGIDRYTHDQLLERLTDMVDSFEWTWNFKDMEDVYEDLHKLRRENV